MTWHEREIIRLESEIERMLIAERRADEKACKEINRLEGKYRYYLWINHGHTGLYGDDGEMQCSDREHGVLDFKRHPLDLIEEKLQAMNIKRLAVAVEKEVHCDHFCPICSEE